MKKTFATLLILTLVASVCGMLFASAVDPVEELKAELEALVGDAAVDAAFNWVAEMEADDTGLVTVTLTVDVVDGREVSYVYGEFYYDTAELTLLNTIADNDADYDMVDCLTSAPSDAYENLSVLKPGADGVIVLNIVNAKENFNGLTGSDSLVLTLNFRLADGVKLTGVYIPTASVEGGEYTYLEPEYMSPVVGNGDYAMLYIEDEDESSADSSSATSGATSDETSGGTSDVPSEPDEPSEPDDPSEDSSGATSNETSGGTSDVPSEPDEPSEEPDDPSEDSSEATSDETSDVTSEPDEPSEEPDDPSEDSSEATSDETSGGTSDVPSEPDDSSEEPDDPSDVPSEPDDSSEESSVASSETSSAAESSEAPKPGDSGILMFAILGLLAIAGAAIAIKARR